MNTAFRLVASVVLLAAPAHADVVHLMNGRLIEGRVIETRGGSVCIEVNGGRITLPAHTVDYIEETATPEDEYASHARRTNMSDPEAVARPAQWASARGLGDQAQHLRELSLGLDREKRVARARRNKSAVEWVDTYQWSKDAGLSPEVQRWLLDQASEADPVHPAVRAATREREVAEAPPAPPAPAAPPAQQAAQDDQRVAQLERELKQRELDERALKERVDQLERDRRLTRRRRNRHP